MCLAQAFKDKDKVYGKIVAYFAPYFWQCGQK